jgi:23S rRNA pseudouridine1911/1915/1917 synthase
MNQDTLKKYIVYDDTHLVVINKPATIPTQADKTKDVSIEELLSKNYNQQIYIIHRLDRVASGLLVFAKNEVTAALLSQQFQNKETTKTYLAIVEHQPPKEYDTPIHFLKKNAKTNTSQVLDIAEKDAKRAELAYILRGASDRYFLLEVELMTGRHHQIRAQLAHIGCPIKGDVKYGARRANKDRSIALHAWKLSFRHPKTGDMLHFSIPPVMDNLWTNLLENIV